MDIDPSPSEGGPVRPAVTRRWFMNQATRSDLKSTSSPGGCTRAGLTGGYSSVLLEATRSFVYIHAISLYRWFYKGWWVLPAAGFVVGYATNEVPSSMSTGNALGLEVDVPGLDVDVSGLDVEVSRLEVVVLRLDVDVTGRASPLPFWVQNVILGG